MYRIHRISRSYFCSQKIFIIFYTFRIYVFDECLKILKDDQGVVSSVFIYGHTATGKSLVATSLLEAFEVSAYISTNSLGKWIRVCVDVCATFVFPFV